MSKNYEKSEYRMYVTKEEEVKPPLYYCKSCTHCSHNYCSVFKRPIVNDYNKCFYHSNYSPISAVLQVSENIDEIIVQEQAA